MGAAPSGPDPESNKPKTRAANPAATAPPTTRPTTRAGKAPFVKMAALLPVSSD